MIKTMLRQIKKLLNFFKKKGKKHQNFGVYMDGIYLGQLDLKEGNHPQFFINQPKK